jgi:hypothetical protein
VASHPVGHSADAAKNRAERYYSNRSRWPFEQVGMLVAARKELQIGDEQAATRWLVREMRHSGRLQADWKVSTVNGSFQSEQTVPSKTDESSPLHAP